MTIAAILTACIDPHSKKAYESHYERTTKQQYPLQLTIENLLPDETYETAFPDGTYKSIKAPIHLKAGLCLETPDKTTPECSRVDKTIHSGTQITTEIPVGELIALYRKGNGRAQFRFYASNQHFPNWKTCDAPNDTISLIDPSSPQRWKVRVIKHRVAVTKHRNLQDLLYSRIPVRADEIPWTQGYDCEILSD